MAYYPPLSDGGLKTCWKLGVTHMPFNLQTVIQTDEPNFIPDCLKMKMPLALRPAQF